MADAIEIVELSKDLEPAYSAFVRRDPASMIYGTLAYRDFLQQCVGGTPRYFVATTGSEVVGALPCFVAHHHGWGEVVNSLPWYGSHGGCQLQPASAGVVRSALLARLREVMNGPAVAFASMVLTPAENFHLSEYVTALGPAATDQRIGQITELPDDSSDLEARLEAVCRPKTRNLTRKARQQGFTIESRDDDEGWRFLFETHVENMAAMSGRAKPWAHFVAMRAAIPRDWRQLSVTMLDGRPVAAILLFRFNQTVEYVTPVIKHEYRSKQPLTFAIWHGMIDAVRQGYRRWNWGGTWSSQDSLHHFKAGWGAKDLPYSYVARATPAAMNALRDQRDAIVAAFPYYFLYPYSALGE